MPSQINSPLTRSFEQRLPTVVAEIEESLAYLAHAACRFAEAYLPYTLLGRVAIEELQQAGQSETQARQFIRKGPEYVDEGF